MKKVALVFAGQGAHKKGMAGHLLGEGIDPRKVAIQRQWRKAASRLADEYGFDINTAIRDNPSRFDYGLGEYRQTLKIPDGVLTRTPFTQPAMLIAQWAIFQEMLLEHPELAAPTCCGGHSLGEFTALVSRDIFPLDVAVELVHERGICMEDSIDLSPHSPFQFQMFAVSPERAEITDDELALFVELISRTLVDRNCFLELVNYNVRQNQTVVTGTNFALAALGKCLDPLFRTNAVEQGADNFGKIVAFAVEDVERDVADGVSESPDTPPPPPLVHARDRGRRREAYHRKALSPDGGYTLPDSHLQCMGYIGNGRSGLKRRSWYVPVSGVKVPFHSSLLRRGMDNFHPFVSTALPSAEVIRGKLEEAGTSFLCNLTGTRFCSDKDSAFRAQAADYTNSMNVGEQTHHGRYESEVEDKLLHDIKHGDAKELLAAVLTAQLAHAVLWHDCMSSMVLSHHCRSAVEVSPAPTLSDMFKRESFVPHVGQSSTDGSLSSSDTTDADKELGGPGDLLVAGPKTIPPKPTNRILVNSMCVPRDTGKPLRDFLSKA